MNSLNHKQFFADTEYNNGGGFLIAAALAATDGAHWYEAVIPEEGTEVTGWAKHHVLPVLGKVAISRVDMVASLAKFLSQYDSVTIVMDNNNDAKHFGHLFDIMDKKTLIQLQFVKPRTGVKHLSKVPHNALSDAYGLMESVLGSTVRDCNGVSPRAVYQQLADKNIGLNTINSEYRFEGINDQGDAIVKVYPISTGATRKTLNRWSDSYEHAIGHCYLTVALA